jgi:hypothetical protein
MANEVLMVPEEQWEMPVSITPDGRWISLREFSDQKIVTLSPGSLPKQLVPAGQEAELVEKRIAYRADFKVAMIGIGIVDQERAMQEVRKQTPAGRTLINIELRTIARVIELANEGDR